MKKLVVWNWKNDNKIQALIAESNYLFPAMNTEIAEYWQEFEVY